MNVCRNALIALSLIVSAAGSQAAPSKGATALAASGCRIIGYVPSWRGDIQAIQYDKLTHINYAFLEVSPEGSLQPLDTARLKAVVEKAHAHGVKVLISVGGGANSAVLGPLIVNPATRKALIPKLLAFMDAHRLDGLDIDWEYPKNASDTAPYEDLMTSLAKALHPKGKLLTTATIGEPWAGDAISAKTLKALDFMNIMAYDVNGEQHSSFAAAHAQMTYWLNRGLPKSKAILGVPFYGYPVSGGREVSFSFKDLVAANPASAQSDTSKDLGGVSYNGIPTMRQKAQLAMQIGAGIMVWELTFDAPGDNSLLKTIHDTLCATPAAQRK